TKLMLLVGAYFSATSLVTVAAPRLRAPLDVFVFVAAGVAIAALVARVQSRRRDGVTVASERDAVVARPSDPGRNRAFVGTVVGALVIVLAVGFVARRKVEHDTSRKAKALAVAARPDIDRVASQYP